MTILRVKAYSISNQKKLLIKITKEKGYTNLVHFSDDGISGVTMERPSFVAMIQKLEEGHAAAVFVKDMSRLGRNYIEVRKFTEKFLLDHDIRLVAVSDDVDTADVVMTLIADTLRAITAYSKNDRAESIQTVKEAQVAQQSNGIAQKKKRLTEAKKRSENSERLLCQIYEDKILGKLPEARFATLGARYADEQDELSDEIEELE